MHKMVGKVFYFIGILLVSTLMFLFVFGGPGRYAMWSAMNPAFQQAWKAQTFDDGKMLSQNLDANFSSLHEVIDN